MGYPRRRVREGVPAARYPCTLHPHPSPYTLHPTRHTLHPTRHTLHGTTYTTQPTRRTLPYTNHLSPCTLHPSPLLHPPPSTLVHETPYPLSHPQILLIAGASKVNRVRLSEARAISTTITAFPELLGTPSYLTQSVFQSFCRSQLPPKSVNLSYIFPGIKGK